ncbi:Zn(2)-C6 fungal-type domain-containing protein [[Candida] zeylanoides]
MSEPTPDPVPATSVRVEDVVTSPSSSSSKAQRRPVACKSCHALKVKCTPANENDPAGPCLRCLNSKRHCEIDLNQTRKRRKKTWPQSTPHDPDPHHPHTQQHPHQPQPPPPLHPLPAPQPQLLQQPHQHYSHQPPYIQSNNRMHGSTTSSGQSPPPPLLAQGGSPHFPGIGNGAVLPQIGNSPSMYSLKPDLSAYTEPIVPPHLNARDEVITRLEEQVRYLTSELQNSRQLQGRQKQELQRLQPQTSFSPPSPSIYVSKYDLEREIGLLCDSSSAALTDLTTSLKETADRRAYLLNGQAAPVDVVSVGLLSVEDATERLELYRNKIFKRHPLVNIGNASVQEMQATKPYLFNAIMSITNAIYTKPVDLDTSLAIDNAAIQSITTEVLVAGSKSEELICSLLLLCHWYNTPELFRHRRYHLLNVLSVTMLHDLGIVGKPTYSFGKRNTISQSEQIENEDKKVEYRKLIMILYFSTVSICLILRRTIYVKWTPYVEECCSILETSGNETSVNLALFSRLSHELDRIHHIIHAPEICEPAPPAEGDNDQDTTSKHPKTTPKQIKMPRSNSSAGKYISLEIQKNLFAIKSKIDPEDHPFLAYYHSVEAYLHEPMLGNFLTTESDDGSEVLLSSEAVASVSTCTNSCLNALEQFNYMSPSEISTMPLFYSSRIIYTAGMLLRLRYLILSLPSNIEKDLVPQEAVTAIQTLSGLIEASSKEHPSNHFLKKICLVLTLFIQTYATQVQALLKKNGETPDNFRPSFSKREQSELSRLSELYRANQGGGLITHESGRPHPPQVPLDILSYAASFRGSVSNGSPSSTNKSPRNDSSNYNNTNGTTHVDSATSEYASKSDTVPKYKSPIIGAYPLRTENGNTASSDAPLPLPPLNGRKPSYLGSLLNPKSNTLGAKKNNDPSLQQPPRHNLADADQLESSYLALNDEFWADLLRTDQDKVNFTNNVYSQANDELFFL